MKLIPNWLLRLVAGLIIQRALRTPYFHLQNSDGSPYMNRYWLFRLFRTEDRDHDGGSDEDTAHGKIAARVHWIRSSDEGRVFHDHPWDFVTIILRGGYYELTPVDSFSLDFRKRWHGAGSVLFRRAADWHRLLIDPERAGGETWTLFIMLPKKQSWGFRVRGKKIHWRAYLSIRQSRNEIT